MKIILISIISILIILSSSIRIHKKGKISLFSESHQPTPTVIYTEEKGEIKMGPAVENTEKRHVKKDEKTKREEENPKVEEESKN